MSGDEKVIASGSDLIETYEHIEEKEETITYEQYVNTEGYKTPDSFIFCKCGHRKIGHFTTPDGSLIYKNGKVVGSMQGMCMHHQCNCNGFEVKKEEEA